MSRGGKIAVKLLVTLVVIGGVCIAADRFAVRIASNRIAREVASALEARGTVTSGTPTVEIAGFPFLTQVLAGEYEKITISIDQPKISKVQLVNLDLTASTVRADTQSLLNGTGSVTADAVVGTANLSWGTVREILDVGGIPGLALSEMQLTVDNDQVRLRMPVPSLGHGVVLVGTGSLGVTDGLVRLRIGDVKAEGGALPALVQRQVDQLGGQLSASLKIPELPYNLTVDTVKTTSSGITIKAGARDVTLGG